MKINASNTATEAARLLQSGYREKLESDFQKILSQAQKEQDDQKLRETCREMEALFIHQMLRQMRATVPQGGLITESNVAKIYRDMLDEAYSKLIASSHNNLGLAELIYNQLKKI